MFKQFLFASVHYGLDLSIGHLKLFCQWLKADAIDQPAAQYLAVAL